MMTSLNALFNAEPARAGVLLQREGVERSYVYTGRVNGSNGYVWLLSDTGALIMVDPTDESGWTYVKDAFGDRRMADPLVVRTAVSLVDREETIERQRIDANEQRTKIARMFADWELLNEKLNDESKSRDWCGVYDQCVESWNEEFSVFQLQPRAQDYNVEVTITATWTVSVPVENMHSADDAMDYVRENYSAAECLSAAGDSWSTPDDSEIEVNDADVAD
jgi:hypothetical protein